MSNELPPSTLAAGLRACARLRPSARQIMTGLISVMACLSSAPLSADDTSLYVYESSNRSDERPQVLVIFDNSGSMDTTVYGVNPSFTNTSGDLSDGEQIYYSLDAAETPPNPANPAEKRFFTYKRNACASSFEFLKEQGVFTGFMRHYVYSGQTGSWEEFPRSDGASIRMVECFEDIQDKNYDNGSVAKDGLPVDGEGRRGSPSPFYRVSSGSREATKELAMSKAKNTGFGTGRVVTLYTKTYLTWYHSKKKQVNRTRIDIAKEAITNVLLTTPGVDFGLAIFNSNVYEGYDDGGRIIARIKPATASYKKDLIEAVDLLDGTTWTPLCETLYEAYRYFSGGEVWFGDDDPTLKPYRDKDAIEGKNYKSPFKDCQNRAYVVYVTDGEPTRDTNANDLVLGLTGGVDAYTDSPSSYLSSLSSWMNTNDVNPNMTGKQSVSTYTIGFSQGAASAAGLLRHTAEKGGGKYYDATNVDDLQKSLMQVFKNILEKNASFTAPAVASNNFNRIQTFDSVYYSMFLPNRGPRWSGNLKKFKVTDGGDIIDANKAKVIDGDGNIAKTACSHWSSSADCSAGDGNDVRRGGAAGMLQRMQAKDRNLLSDVGGLKPLTLSAASTKAGGNVALAALLGVDEAEVANLIDWARGVDVDDDNDNGNLTEMRADIMGDPLHSKPLAINFGSEGSPDIRVIVGTNQGVLHMFKDEGASVSESWAYLPWEMLPKQAALRENLPSGRHSVYGIDGSPVAWVKSGASGIQKAWLFFGLRRGGDAYYALDITNPDTPRFMWRIDGNSPGMDLLGQSWSKPVVTFIPGRESSPVLIFGGGYSPSNKDIPGVGTPDNLGTAVFIVDAATGALVHSFGPNNAGNMTVMPSIKDSIPNEVAVLDANNDGLTDRIYATDTGGNVWRMDMPGTTPKDANRRWSAFKFASLGGMTTGSDRRFFAAPVVAQTALNNTLEFTSHEKGRSTTVTTVQTIPYDAVVVGSGIRPAPQDDQREDMFFTLQDRNIGIRSFDGSNKDRLPPSALTLADLYDVTSAPPTTKEEEVRFGKLRGWYYNFTRKGEKSLSAGSIIRGRVFFTSYVPGSAGAPGTNQCLIPGKGYLYGFDLHKGTRSYNQTYLEMGESVPDTPQLVVPSSKAMYLIGIGKAPELMVKTRCEDNNEHCDGCPPGDEKCIGGGMNTRKIYYYAN
ncbi:pilus assembly protein [Shewanella sp. FJAT-52076]|uniref:pilus assembly protein n=1 Tax=Shewanella sp. FJAT-52076 TaxID=2864202 RepID=UPI0021ACDD00|nr:PilC/PilY family type IV pilus protein [Shewanella sp. FJAT-52076]